MSKPAIQVVLELLSRFSLKTLYRLSGFASYLISRTANQISRQSDQNIKLCFGKKSATEKKQFARDSIKHTSHAFFELAAVWCWPAETILERISEQDVCAQFSQSSKGKIIIAPHLGSWELFNIWLAQDALNRNALKENTQNNNELLSLYKPPKNKSLDQFIINSRSRNGAKLLPTNQAGLRNLLRGLKQGASAMILPDQKPSAKKSPSNARFFGLDAPTSNLVHSLCSKIDCDVFLGYVHRQTAKAQFAVYLQPLDHSKLAASDITSLQYMNDEIQRAVLLHPEQYQWGYRRFSESEYQ